MGKKRKFIDKKNSVTFRLVHRSQKDPLATDENAPKRVLQPVETARKDELEKFGIFHDDDYDYMQHLKETTTGSDLVRVKNSIQPRVEVSKVITKDSKVVLLPSSVFPSDMEAKVGLLNKAAPRSGLQLDLDPDIVAAMDEDYDYEDPDNLLDDDFVLQANGGVLDSHNEEEMDSDFDDIEEEEFDSDSFDSNERMDQLMNLEETKSRFTEYSMTSSVIRRNEQLTLLDNKFDKMFQEYDDSEVGALDCEELEGDLDNESELLKKMTEEFENANLEELVLEKPQLNRFAESDSDESEGSLIEVKPKEQWDCESILSTYSNIYNHPKIITNPQSSRIKVSSRTGIPIDDHKLTKNALSKLETEECEAKGPGSVASIVSSLCSRMKNETPEERVGRKKAYKEFKRERRVERKMNKEAFKEEKKRLEKVLLNQKTLKRQIPV